MMPIQHPKLMLFASLCALVTAGIALGITTPQAAQAKVELHTAEHAGDALFHSAKLGTNGLTCDTCHVDGGRFSHRLGARRIPSLVGAKTLFPEPEANGQVRTLEQQINLCIKRGLQGKSLPQDSRKLALLDLYIRNLSRFHER